jgi:nitrate reductase gamma subunit
MLQTAQRVGSAIGVAIVLAQFFDRIAASHGQDYAVALSMGLRTVLGFVGVALLFGLVDLVRRRAVQQRPEPRHALAEPEPRQALR